MNRLQHESSHYLREHADDLVDWHPWDAEALELAKNENKPILLSIGYAANHRCRKMTRESFQSNKVADFMNENYVNILVDREERPDLDRIYQNAQQLLNRQPGGWPLTMFLDPGDQLPLFGGTYFPPQQTRQQPSFRDVLSGIAKTFGGKNEKMGEFKTKLRDALAPKPANTVSGDFDPTLVDRACGQIDSSYDPEHGGFAEEPKLPHPAGLEMMLDAIECVDEKIKSDRLAQMLDFTLLAMSRGGLYDHLGGGFFGRSNDNAWNTPDFEKLLSDNAALLSLYARRAASTGSDWFRAVANQTADWIMREMQLDSGAVATSQSADVDGDEGRFYVWQRDDIGAVLGDDFDAFASAYGLDKKANFGVDWHLRLEAPDPENWQDTPVAPAHENARAQLFEARASRASAGRDEQIVAASNAFAIRGLVDAARYLDRPDCAAAATRAIDYLRSHHWQDGRLLATSHEGRGGCTAILDDYAALLDALMNSLSVQWRDEDLEFAIGIAEAMLAHFEDSAVGGFFANADDQAQLIQRTKQFGDDTVPAANGNAVIGLLELGYLIGEQRFIAAAERALRVGAAEADDWPSAHATLVRGVMDFTRAAARAIVRVDEPQAAAEWVKAVAGSGNQRARSYVIPAGASALPGALAERGLAADATVSASVCFAGECGDVVTDIDAFKSAIG